MRTSGEFPSSDFELRQPDGGVEAVHDIDAYVAQLMEAVERHTQESAVPPGDADAFTACEQEVLRKFIEKRIGDPWFSDHTLDIVEEFGKRARIWFNNVYPSKKTLH